jgi:predicted metallopeptidase
LLQNERKSKVWEIQAAVVGASGGYILRPIFPRSQNLTIPRRLAIFIHFLLFIASAGSGPLIIIQCANCSDKNNSASSFFFCPNLSSALLLQAFAYILFYFSSAGSREFSEILDSAVFTR